jgi:hypothetical protein
LGAPTGSGILESVPELPRPSSPHRREETDVDESAGEELAVTAGVAVSAMILLFAVFALAVGSWATGTGAGASIGGRPAWPIGRSGSCS